MKLCNQFHENMFYQYAFQIVDELKELDSDSATISEFEQLLLIAHYAHLCSSSAQLGLDDIRAKLATSLLRYTDVIAMDQVSAFHTKSIFGMLAYKFICSFQLNLRLKMSLW